MRGLDEYLLPDSAREAVRLLQSRPGKGCYLAGGTDLLLAPQDDLDFVVDLSRAGLDGIETLPDGSLAIGACATLHALETSPEIRGYAAGVLAAMAGSCGNRPVRTTATVGGNLCNALPSADMIPSLLALDAQLTIFDGTVEQEIPLSEFFVGPRETVLDGRLLTGLVLPAANAGGVCLARKLTRTVEDIALVQVAVALEATGDRITRAAVALGAVAPTALRVEAASALLTGLELDAVADRSAEVAAATTAAAAPIDDHRASADYRRAMVEVLTRRLLVEAAAILSEGSRS